MPRPLETTITSPTDAKGSALEQKVFAALLTHGSALGLTKVVQCHGIYADGWVERKGAGKIPIEIKTTLGWPQLTSACFQLISLNQKLRLVARDAWLIYTRVSPEWAARKQVAGLAHANTCIADFQVGLNIKFVEFGGTGGFSFTGGVSAA